MEFFCSQNATEAPNRQQFCNSGQPPFNATEAAGGYRAESPVFDLFAGLIFVLGLLLFIFAGLLLGLSLLGRLSGRATLNPTVRILLFASFSLFLPVMSYMFSQAKDNKLSPVHLDLHAILVWMILVELLRKKVDAILAAMSSSPLQGVHQQKLLDAVDQIIRIAWIGYLIYAYEYCLIWKAWFIILWVLTLVKAAQLVAAVELAKRSFAVGRNPPLVVGYVAQKMEEEDKEHNEQEEQSNTVGSALFRNCWYVVMGEERLKREAGPDGYRVKLSNKPAKKDLITVGDIWELAEGGDPLLTAHPQLKDLCLSFALFKLLRARFENFRLDDGVARKTRDLIFRAIGRDSGNSDDDDGKKAAERAFRVVELELTFIGEYYHSVVPVALSSPQFFIANYLFVALIVLTLSIIVLVATGNGKMLPLISCLAKEVAMVSRKAIKLFKCLSKKALKLADTMFTSFSILIGLLLFLTFLLMETWEFVVYVLSDWFLVALLCEYARRPKWHSSRWMRRAFGALHWVKQIGQRDMRFSQVFVLDLHRHTSWMMMISRALHHRFLGLTSAPVPKEVKHAIFASLRAKDGEPLSNGESVLRHCDYPHLLWACESKSVAEVILVWHVATSLLEMESSKAPAGVQEETGSDEKVATTLSKYCMYLVACAPELLPEDQEGSKRVCEAATRSLRSALRWKNWCTGETRLEHVMTVGNLEGAAEKGVKLGKQLVKDYAAAAPPVWAMLAKLWTELVIYIAPSDNNVGHAQALTQGDEFITVVWALVTHADITRPPRK